MTEIEKIALIGLVWFSLLVLTVIFFSNASDRIRKK